MMNWSIDKDNSSSKEQSILASSIISAIRVYAKEIFYSKVQTIEMDSGYLYLKGDSQDNIPENGNKSTEVDDLLIISAFVDKEDNQDLIDSILTEILNKIKTSVKNPLKFENNSELNAWITNLIQKRSKIREKKAILFSFGAILLAFFISSLVIGFNYGYFIDKTYEEDLQTILGIFFGLVLVIPSCYIAGDKRQARISSISAIPFSFLIADFTIRYLLTSMYWEQTLGNPFIFLGYLIFISIIGSQLGGLIAEKRYLYRY